MLKMRRHTGFWSNSKISSTQISTKWSNEFRKSRYLRILEFFSVASANLFVQRELTTVGNVENAFSKWTTIVSGSIPVWDSGTTNFSLSWSFIWVRILFFTDQFSPFALGSGSDLHFTYWVSYDSWWHEACHILVSNPDFSGIYSCLGCFSQNGSITIFPCCDYHRWENHHRAWEVA